MFCTRPPYDPDTYRTSSASRLAEQIARGRIGAGHGLPTIAWGVADASGEATVAALVEAAYRAMYRQKQLIRKRTPA